MTRALAALFLASCGGGGAPTPDALLVPECFPTTSLVCTLWISLPGVALPFEWTCTTGSADVTTGRPDHRPCVLCAPVEVQWCEAGNGACVADCATCTPAAALSLDPTARCGTEDAPVDEPVPDMAGWAPTFYGGGPP